MVWYSHLFQNFPQFAVIQTVKGFGIVNKAEIDIFLELSCYFDFSVDVGNLISGSSAFSKAVRTGHGTTNWFQIGKGVCQGCILSLFLFNFYAEYIMRNAGLEKHKLDSRLMGGISIPQICR